MAVGIPDDDDTLWDSIWGAFPQEGDGVSMGSPMVNPKTARAIQRAEDMFRRDTVATAGTNIPSLYLLMTLLQSDEVRAILLALDTSVVNVVNHICGD